MISNDQERKVACEMLNIAKDQLRRMEKEYKDLDTEALKRLTDPTRCLIAGYEEELQEYVARTGTAK